MSQRRLEATSNGDLENQDAVQSEPLLSGQGDIESSQEDGVNLENGQKKPENGQKTETGAQEDKDMVEANKYLCCLRCCGLTPDVDGLKTALKAILGPTVGEFASTNVPKLLKSLFGDPIFRCLLVAALGDFVQVYLKLAVTLKLQCMTPDPWCHERNHCPELTCMADVGTMIIQGSAFFYLVSLLLSYSEKDALRDIEGEYQAGMSNLGTAMVSSEDSIKTLHGATLNMLENAVRTIGVLEEEAQQKLEQSEAAKSKDLKKRLDDVVKNGRDIPRRFVVAFLKGKLKGLELLLDVYDPKDKSEQKEKVLHEQKINLARSLLAQLDPDSAGCRDSCLGCCMPKKKLSAHEKVMQPMQLLLGTADKANETSYTSSDWGWAGRGQPPRFEESSSESESDLEAGKTHDHQRHHHHHQGKKGHHHGKIPGKKGHKKNHKDKKAPVQQKALEDKHDGHEASPTGEAAQTQAAQEEKKSACCPLTQEFHCFNMVWCCWYEAPPEPVVATADGAEAEGEEAKSCWKPQGRFTYWRPRLWVRLMSIPQACFVLSVPCWIAWTCLWCYETLMIVLDLFMKEDINGVAFADEAHPPEQTCRAEGLFTILSCMDGLGTRLGNIVLGTVCAWMTAMLLPRLRLIDPVLKSALAHVVVDHYETKGIDYELEFFEYERVSGLLQRIRNHWDLRQVKVRNVVNAQRPGENAWKDLIKNLEAEDAKVKEEEEAVRLYAQCSELEHGAKLFAHSDFQELQRNAHDKADNWEHFSTMYVHKFTGREEEVKQAETQSAGVFGSGFFSSEKGSGFFGTEKGGGFFRGSSPQSPEAEREAQREAEKQLMEQHKKCENVKAEVLKPFRKEKTCAKCEPDAGHEAPQPGA